MPFKLHVIFRYDDFETPFWMLDLHQLQDFQIVIVNFWRQWKRTDIDDVNKRILYVEQPRDLCIFFLFVLFNCHSLNFRNRKRIDMNFRSPLCFNFWPFKLKFILHLGPYFHLIISELLELFIGL
jgi:hypothetical protein